MTAFIKVEENFACEHCGASVVGTGYTNHCPHCLWSKHVDTEPGDRAASCGGMMAPIALEGSTPEYVLVHKCERCGHIKRNKISEKDEEEAVIALAQKLAS